MDPLIFFKGIGVGLVMCAPIGPIGVLCVRRTLLEGRLAGMVSVLGASAADGLYCALAGMGIAFLSDWLAREQIILRLVGGVVLVLLGGRIFFARPRLTKTRGSGRGLWDAFFSTFFLMLANPMPIVAFTATFAALGLTGWQRNYGTTATLVIGVTLGSALWAPALATLAHRIRPQIERGGVPILNRISGGIILGFGLVLGLASLLK